MSNVPQGAGWWMASDGKWYPPHLHPWENQGSVQAPPEVRGAPGSTASPQYGEEHPNPVSPPAGAYSVPTPQTWSIPPLQGEYPPGYGPPPGYQPAPGFGIRPAGWTQPGLGPRIDVVLHQALAPWWKRFVAVTIDWIMLIIFYGVVLVTITAATTNYTAQTSTTSAPLNAGQVIGALLALWLVASQPSAVYFAIMNGSRRGQTVGKMALGIAVRDARSGQPIRFWRSLGRNLITVVFGVVLWIPFVLDSLAPLWNGRRQAWHDSMAHSVVIDLHP